MMNMETVMGAAMDAMMDAQAAGNPQLAALRPVMTKFMKKHMSWKSLETEYLKIYVDAFTQGEIEDLLEFYETPTGKKSILVMPKLMQQGATIGQQRVQANLPELKRMITEAQARPSGQ